MNLYVWLKFFHLAALVLFLFGHGATGLASFALRGPVTAQTRMLLTFSQRSSYASTPALLVILITGVWMTFAGSWSSHFWPWAALVVILVVAGVMGYIARPYYMARGVMNESDDLLAQQLKLTRPVLAAGIGGVGLLVLVVLMVFKPL